MKVLESSERYVNLIFGHVNNTTRLRRSCSSVMLLKFENDFVYTCSRRFGFLKANQIAQPTTLKPTKICVIKISQVQNWDKCQHHLKERISTNFRFPPMLVILREVNYRITTRDRICKSHTKQ